MSRILVTMAVAAIAAMPLTVSADTLDMSPAADAGFDAPGKPTRGMTQDRVRSQYGEPRSRESAVGEPPISRWHYDGFVVYFEFDKVIHSVSKR